jgi:uncharacterized protein YegL
MTNPTVVQPGMARLSHRPLHFFWVCDCSGSMAVLGKIQALNTAIREAIPMMQQTASENPNAQVLVRAIRFSDGAQWHIPQPTPIDEFHWSDLSANGLTDMGKALSMVAEQLKVPPMSDRALPPVVVLISDGQPTDDFSSGLKALMDQPWGKKAVRLAIAIGQDADYEILQKFIGHSELKPLTANNPEQLVQRIRWLSTVVVKGASQNLAPAQETPKDSSVPIPNLLMPTMTSRPKLSNDTVW